MLCRSSAPAFNSPKDCKQLYQFLDFCHQKAVFDGEVKIASVVLDIPSIDPLAVLYRLAQPDQLHFYFEQREADWAIAALGASVFESIEGVERFSKAQKFVQEWTQQLVLNNANYPAWKTPNFFCSFTFDDQPLQVVDPFPHATIFLPQWQVVKSHNEAVLIANIPIDTSSNLEYLTAQIWQQLQRIQRITPDYFTFSKPYPNGLDHWQIIDIHNFEAAVSEALRSIQQKHFDKLVLAHAIDVISPVPFQPAYSLHRLRQRHPDCYVFSIGNGKGQSFIGASPERLLSISESFREGKPERHLITDALAGSAPRGTTRGQDEDLAQCLLDSPKERHEHQVVVDFMTEKLMYLGLKPHLAKHPTVLQLSNIQHLHTPIQTIVPAHLHPLEIVAELHPTPAVAGLPRDIACQQIRQHEQFDRSLYAAPLGWVDCYGNAEFIVGIRSALLQGDRARLYAGAGIVAGSDPSRELAEVRLKLQALLQSLV